MTKLFYNFFEEDFLRIFTIFLDFLEIFVYTVGEIWTDTRVKELAFLVTEKISSFSFIRES